MAKVLVLIGTKKGAFIAESDGERRQWTLRGPFCNHWPIHHLAANPATGAIHGAGGNEWFGPAVWTSRDLGETWTHSSQGLAYAEGEEPVAAAWSIAARDGELFAGVQPAGLFRSTDGGETFEHVPGLRDHPSRPEWNPGGAGLILHSIVLDPAAPERIWTGISSAGVFYTGDGGKSWEQLREGLPQEEAYDVVYRHAFALDGDRLAFGSTTGNLYVSEDRGESWRTVTNNLPPVYSVRFG